MYVVLVKPFASKWMNLLEVINKVTILCVFVLVLYLAAAGSSLSERKVMDVGYGLLAVILLDVGLNLVVLLATSIKALVEHCQKTKERKKKRRAYAVSDEDKEKEEIIKSKQDSLRRVHDQHRPECDLTRRYPRHGCGQRGRA